MAESLAPLADDQHLYEHAACGLLTCSVDGTVLRMNATACQWLGFDSLHLALGTLRFDDLLTIGGRVFRQTHCEPLLQMQGSVAEVQFDIVHRDGRRIPALVNMVRRRQDMQIYNDIAIFVAADRRAYEKELLLARHAADTSLAALRKSEGELEKINLQLSDAHRRKDEFLATLAHELRNPLAPMRNVVELMKRRPVEKGPPLWEIGIFERQLKQITHLIDDLMEVSRISQGSITLRRETIDLATVLKAAIGDAQDTVSFASHRLVVSIPPRPVIVDADTTRLTQIIANLLNNAAKYSPNGTQIDVRLFEEAAQAVLCVRDAGIGIAPESLTSIFDMFSQLTPALGRAQGGLGIGLALVRGLVELHGGTIVARSVGAGHGSEFEVRLPLSGLLLPTETVVEDGNAAAILPARILIIDDNVDAAESMARALQVDGHLTRVETCGEHGMVAARDAVHDVVLLDIGLPDINGYEVARHLRANAATRHLFMIAATGWGQSVDRAMALDAGFDGHLTKPVDFDSLTQLLLRAQLRRMAVIADST